MKYSVKITEGDQSSYLHVKNRNAWCYRTAKKHALEFLVNWGGNITATIEDQFGDAKKVLF